MKVLLAIAAIFLIYLAMRTLYKRPQQTSTKHEHAEQMLACAHCGLHVPAHEAIMDNTQAYCCEAHLKLANTKKQ